jgi:hypothetical protein
MMWRAPERVLEGRHAPHEAISYIMAPAKPKPPERPKTVQAADRRLRQPAMPIIAPTPQPEPAPAQPQAPQAITLTTPPPDPFAQSAAKPAEDLLQRSLKSAAAVDRQLRKEAWNPRDKRIANDTTLLAAKIGGAYAGNDSGTTTEEITTTDGRLMTKVHTPGGGTYCAYKESNGTTGGRDPFRDGIKTKAMTCPR